MHEYVAHRDSYNKNNSILVRLLTAFQSLVDEGLSKHIISSHIRWRTEPEIKRKLLDVHLSYDVWTDCDHFSNFIIPFLYKAFWDSTYFN